MAVKMKVLAVHTRQRSIEVLFYTDEILAHYEAVLLPERIAQVKASVAPGPDGEPRISDAEAEARARGELECGSRHNITIYQDPMPTGQALIDLLMKEAPSAWLDLRSGIAVNGEPEMLEAKALVGQEIAYERDAVAVLQGTIPSDEALDV